MHVIIIEANCYIFRLIDGLFEKYNGAVACVETGTEIEHLISDGVKKKSVLRQTSLEMLS